MLGLFNHTKPYRLFSVVFCLMFSSAFSAHAAPPTLTNPGTLGGDYSYGADISDDGSVFIGDSFIAGNAEYHGFIYRNGVMTDLGTLGGDLTQASRISADGTTVVGYSRPTGLTDVHAMRWTSGGGMVDLGTLGGDSSAAQAVSANGAFVAGTSWTAGNANYNIFRWDATNGMVDLGSLGGTTGNGVVDMSANGDVIIGTSYITGNTYQHGFRWDSTNGMVDLGTLGGHYSFTTAMSNDGSVVIGNSNTTGNTATHAYRWDSSNGMVDMGTLGGNNSYANAISADGLVIGGSARTSVGSDYVAFRWDSTNGMVALPTLGGSNSLIWGLSANGNVMVGDSYDVGDAHDYITYWTQATGTQSIKEILDNANVNTTGWSLELGNSLVVSADGQYVAGSTTYNGNSTAFIFHYGVPGLITPSAVSQSLQTVDSANKQTASGTAQQIGQTLFMARHINSLAIVQSSSSYAPLNAPTSYGSVSSISTPDGSITTMNSDDAAFGEIEPAAGNDASSPVRAKRGLAIYTLGGVGFGQNNDFNNHDINGTVGIDIHFSDSFNFGVGILGSASKMNLAFDGNAKTNARGVSSILSYEPESYGLRLYNAAFIAGISSDRTRGYMNGSGLDFSRGKTDGIAYGAATQVGWLLHTSQDTSLMPYAEVQVAKTKMDAYTETGGAFPAAFTDQSSTSLTSHIGVEHKYNFNPTMNFLGRLAWGHRLGNGGGDYSATSAGLTQVLGSNDDSDKNWAEATIGIGWQASEKFHMNAEISGRSGDTAEPAVNLTFGASYAF